MTCECHDLCDKQLINILGNTLRRDQVQKAVSLDQSLKMVSTIASVIILITTLMIDNEYDTLSLSSF